MAGPEETRLIRALTGAEPGRAGGGAREWDNCATMLDRVASRLETTAMPIPIGEAGAQTAEAMNAAFGRSAAAMRQRAERLREGHQALVRAETVMEDARREYERLGAEGTGPTKPSGFADPQSEAALNAEARYAAEHAAFVAEQERRERVAKQWADQMDVVFVESADKMREIHGEPPPPPPPLNYDGEHGGIRSPKAGHVPIDGNRHHDGDSGNNGNDDDKNNDNGNDDDSTDNGTDNGNGNDNGNDDGNGLPQGPTTLTPLDPTTPGINPTGNGGVSPSTGLGVGGAAGGAVAGGLLGAGLTAGGIRGGAPVVASPGTAASGVRGVGATSRTGASSTLGRAGATAPGAGGSPTRAGAGAGRAGAGAGRAGAGAGRGGAASGRGGAGARGGAGGAGGRGSAGGRSGAAARGAGGAGAGAGRGRGKDDEKRGKDDIFEAPEDWVGEDEAAPAILD